MMTRWGRRSCLDQHRHAFLSWLPVVYLMMLPGPCLGFGTSLQYLYYDIPGHKVREYMAEQGQQPDFLYSDRYPTGRVVEFYAQ
jgi:hypothetical protein